MRQYFTRLVLGYIIILSVFFTIKFFNKLTLTFAKGVVVDRGWFKYKSLFGHYTFTFPYPVVAFEGPERSSTQSDDMPDNVSVNADEIKNTHDTDLAKLYTTTKNRNDTDTQTVYEREGVAPPAPDTGKLYTTTEPLGSYFSTEYQAGDSLEICYHAGKPKEAIVYSFSSYWLTLPALTILIFLCIVWTGVNNVIEMSKEPQFDEIDPEDDD